MKTKIQFANESAKPEACVGFTNEVVIGEDGWGKLFPDEAGKGQGLTWSKYRQTFFDALVTHCRTDAGYTTLKSVVTMEKGDLMPSYFLAETLKYLYLLFAPESVLDLDAVVLNTEAHPFRRP